MALRWIESIQHAIPSGHSSRIQTLQLPLRRAESCADVGLAVHHARYHHGFSLFFDPVKGKIVSRADGSVLVRQRLQGYVDGVSVRHGCKSLGRGDDLVGGAACRRGVSERRCDVACNVLKVPKRGRQVFDAIHGRAMTMIRFVPRRRAAYGELPKHLGQNSALRYSKPPAPLP